MIELFNHFHEILFIASITYIFYILINILFKMYGRFKLNESTRVILSSAERIILWISITLFVSYLTYLI